MRATILLLPPNVQILGCTYKKETNPGSSKEDSAKDSRFSIKCANSPVTPPMTRLVISRTFGAKSSETIAVQPLFSNNSAAFCPPSTKPYP